MGEPGQDKHKHPKDSDQPSNPTKKRRIVESNGCSSHAATEGVAPSPSASDYREQSDQRQPHYVSESVNRPLLNGNCASNPCAAPTRRKLPAASAVNGKQDSLEERKQLAQSPRGFCSSLHGPQDSNTHQVDCHLGALSLPLSQRHAVEQEHFASAVASGTSTSQTSGSTHDNHMTNSSGRSQVTQSLENSLAIGRDGRFGDESCRHHHLVNRDATERPDNALFGTLSRPGISYANMSPSRDIGDILGHRDAGMYSLNDQVAFAGRQDSETSRRLEDAIALLSYSIRNNNQGEYLNRSHQEERRLTPDSIYSHDASILPTMFPSGAGLQTASSVASVAPFSSDLSSQHIRQLIMVSLIPSYREASPLYQRNHNTETEMSRLLARIRQSNPLHPQTYASDRPQAGIYRGEQSYDNSVVRDLRHGHGNTQLQASHDSGHLDCSVNASRLRASSFAALSSDDSGAFSNRQILPPVTTSAAHLLPPISAPFAQNTSETSRGAQEAVAPTHSLPVTSISQLLPPNQFQAEEHAAVLSGNNDNGGNREWEESSPWRPSGVLGSNCVAPLPPPCVEGSLPQHSERTVLPLGIPQDKEYCSEFAYFVRSQLVEVFRASGEDVADRINNKRIVWHQVGIRCRFCAHLPRTERAHRATTFPSSINRLQTSVSMMTREHFPLCSQVPEEIMSVFKMLQESQYATSPEKKTDAYWSKAAKQLGLVDREEGIMFQTEEQPVDTATPLVEDNDRRLVPDYLYFLMSQAQRISLGKLDRSQNGQHSLPLGTAGFGCRHCSEFGVSTPHVLGGPFRIFAQKIRQLPSKANHFHDHLQQCEQCPDDIKACMSLLKSSVERKELSNTEKKNEKLFFNRIFVRLHGNVPIGVPVDCRDSTENINLVYFLQKEEAAASE
jgi:hypothetical protein